jgi:hypothetical protein
MSVRSHAVRQLLMSGMVSISMACSMSFAVRISVSYSRPMSVATCWSFSVMSVGTFGGLEEARNHRVLRKGQELYLGSRERSTCPKHSRPKTRRQPGRSDTLTGRSGSPVSRFMVPKDAQHTGQSGSSLLGMQGTRWSRKWR